MLHVSIIEHRAVYNAVPWQLVKGRPAYLAVANHHIVVRSPRRLDAQLPKYEYQHRHKAVEGKRHIVALGDKGKHDIVPVGIHTAAAALASEHLYTMLPTVLGIHLVLHHLIPAEDNSWSYLPHEEAIGLIYVSRHIFLHGQVERKVGVSTQCIGQCYVLHIARKFMKKDVFPPKIITENILFPHAADIFPTCSSFLFQSCGDNIYAVGRYVEGKRLAVACGLNLGRTRHDIVGVLHGILILAAQAVQPYHLCLFC